MKHVSHRSQCPGHSLNWVLLVQGYKLKNIKYFESYITGRRTLNTTDSFTKVYCLNWKERLQIYVELLADWYLEN